MNLLEKLEIAVKYEESKSIWRKKNQSDEYIFCSNLNFELFGKKFNGSSRCECIDDFFILVKSRLKNKEKIIKIMEKKFYIKKGRVVRPFGSKALDRNSSDEDCINLLKGNPNFIKEFDEFPKDWKVLIGIEQKIEEQKIEEKPIKKIKIKKQN